MVNLYQLQRYSSNSSNFISKLLTAFNHERALLLGRVGRHEEALSIYIHILKDPKLAEEWVFLRPVNINPLVILSISYV